MARTGRPRSGPDLVVTEAQRRELVRGARAATSTQAYALRCWPVPSRVRSTPMLRRRWGLYHNPPERAVVLCVDEKSQIQALDRSQPVLPMMPGMPERRTRDYARHGTARPACSPRFNIADGTVIGELHRRHRATEFRKLLTSIDNAVPAELDVHVVCDNYATHKTPLVQRCLAAHPRFHGALHPDRIFVAQPGRTLVHPLHPATTTAQRPQKRCGPGGRRPQLGRPKNTSSIRHPGPPSTDVVQLGCGHDVRIE